MAIVNPSQIPDLSRSQVRAVDRIAIQEFGLQGVVLMENAGRGCVDLLRQEGIAGPVVICCGKGNNGGDGFVIARHLVNLQIPTQVLLLARPEEITGDAAENLQILQKMKIPLPFLSLPSQQQEFASIVKGADWIVDAMLGTGTTGSIREPYVTAIGEINRAGRKVLAVDLPSGLDCDTGHPLGPCIQATLTATFVAEKTGFHNPEARQYLGRVQIVDIGVPRQAIQQAINDYP